MCTFDGAIRLGNRTGILSRGVVGMRVQKIKETDDLVTQALMSFSEYASRGCLSDADAGKPFLKRCAEPVSPFSCGEAMCVFCVDRSWIRRRGTIGQG